MKLQERFKQTLSQRERLVLTLCYCDELSIKEIGLALELPAIGVESMLVCLRQRALVMRERMSGGHA